MFAFTKQDLIDELYTQRDHAETFALDVVSYNCSQQQPIRE